MFYPHMSQDKLNSVWLQPLGEKPLNPTRQPVANARAVRQPRGREAVSQVCYRQHGYFVSLLQFDNIHKLCNNNNIHQPVAFLGYTLLVLAGTPFCLQNCFSSSQHGIEKSICFKVRHVVLFFRPFSLNSTDEEIHQRTIFKRLSFHVIGYRLFVLIDGLQ